MNDVVPNALAFLAEFVLEDPVLARFARDAATDLHWLGEGGQ